MNLTTEIRESKTFRIPLTDDGVVFEDAAEYVLFWTLKRKASDADTAAVIQKISGYGIELDEDPTFALVTIVPDDTDPLSVGNYVWDVRGRHVDTGARKTLARGHLKLDQDITREVDASIPIFTSEPPAPLGPSGTVEVGTVTTGEEGSQAAVENVGTLQAAVLNFTIPRGYVGLAATITIGNVATGDPGSSVVVENTGSSGAAVFDFTIPKGEKGDVGDTSIIPIDNVTDTTRTVTPTQAGRVQRCSNAAGCAITTQPNATASWTEGQVVYFRRMTSAGALTWNNTGITIAGDKISQILAGEEFAIRNTGTNTFDFV